MTYFSAMGPRLAAELGAVQVPTGPHVRCDGCSAVYPGETKAGRMASWLRKDIAPPGWLRLRHEHDLVLYRRDYCKSCRSAVRVTEPVEPTE